MFQELLEEYKDYLAKKRGIKTMGLEDLVLVSFADWLDTQNLTMRGADKSIQAATDARTNAQDVDESSWTANNHT